MKIDLHNKYIYAEAGGLEHNKPAYSIFNSNTDYLLGEIQYYPRWRQYVFIPEPNTVFNKGCMESIIKFIDTLAP